LVGARIGGKMGGAAPSAAAARKAALEQQDGKRRTGKGTEEGKAVCFSRPAIYTHPSF
jgi:hypothetical protein